MPSRRILANTLRVLSMDTVQRAASGHPGAPMGLADMAEVLWNDHLRHNPGNPAWPNRDRFVLSNGHACALLYALLHLSGYDLSLEDLRAFRQWGSRTPGHPEHGLTPGVEATTGPLGQGFANAVGMALAEKMLAQRFNRPGFPIVDHYTYVFLGDGCLMEGISHEAASLAGTLGLGKLILCYDDNGISIDGEVRGWFRDDTAQRFRACNWHVPEPLDGHDAEAVDAALKEARTVADRPSLLCCRTVIGSGAPHKAGTAQVHGSPLGEEEVAATRSALQWPHAPFEIPPEIRTAWDARASGARREEEWRNQLAQYRRKFPQAAQELERRLAGELPADFNATAQALLHRTQEEKLQLATRQSSGRALAAFAQILPELIGGSADLAESNGVLWSGTKPISAEDADGNHIHYGVREFAMSAIVNGIALHGAFINYGATFLTFMDYARNAVRMAALMNQPSIFLYSHDSIGLGEDGPTHQPVEQLGTLRCTPGLETWRPCDAVECTAAWQEALQRRHGPTALILSRQKLPPQERTPQQVDAVTRGGYILLQEKGTAAPQLIFLATGSEVAPVMHAALALQQEKRRVRVVSMPCLERFAAQEESYREAVLPGKARRRLAVEAGHPGLWYRYVGDAGMVLGLERFGASAPGPKALEELGFSAARVLEAARTLLAAS